MNGNPFELESAIYYSKNIERILEKSYLGVRNMLSNLLKPAFVQLDIDAVDFEDAIKKSTKPLLDDGAIKSEYIDEIVTIYKELGPYIVITPGIALPHAPSTAGSVSLGIGFTRLKKAVKSGHQTNDPVKFLFPLSAPDNQSHINALSDLARLLSNDEFVTELGKVENNKEFYELIKMYEGEMYNA